MRLARNTLKAGAITYVRADGDADGRQRHLRRAQGDRRRCSSPLRAKPRVCRTKAKKCAGSARRSPDRFRPAIARVPVMSEALRPDFQARDGEPDGIRQPRTDHDHAARAAGRNELRATGQVVRNSPASLRCSFDQKDDEEASLLPLMHKSDCPAKRSRRRNTSPSRRRAAQLGLVKAAGGTRHR